MNSVHILGAGALGSLWGAQLARAGVPTTMLVRPSSPLLAGHCGIRVRELWRGDAEKAPNSTARVAFESSSSPSLDPIRTLLVLTKAFSAREAIEGVAHRLSGSDSMIFLLCNAGLAVTDEVRASPLLQHCPLILGTTTHGAFLETHAEDIAVVWAGSGKCWFGSADPLKPPPEKLRSRLGILASSGLTSGTPDQEISVRLWQKLAANAALNPLTALGQKLNGEVLECSADRQAMEEVVEEVAAVARQKFGPDPALSAPELLDFVTRCALDNKRNRSSMFQDVLLQRRTEIDHLNGWVVSCGIQLGIPTPRNKQLFDAVQSLEAAYAPAG